MTIYKAGRLPHDGSRAEWYPFWGLGKSGPLLGNQRNCYVSTMAECRQKEKLSDLWPSL
jgi:hypothetical protein